MDAQALRTLQRAARSFRQRRLADAESLCRRLLETHAGAADVLHLLALVRRQLLRFGDVQFPVTRRRS